IACAAHGKPERASDRGSDLETIRAGERAEAHGRVEGGLFAKDDIRRAIRADEDVAEAVAIHVAGRGYRMAGAFAPRAVEPKPVRPVEIRIQEGRREAGGAAEDDENRAVAGKIATKARRADDEIHDAIAVHIAHPLRGESQPLRIGRSIQ